MKVQGPPKPRLQPLGEARAKAGAKEGAVAPSGGERVAVSNMSRMIADARGPAELDLGRIQRLKAAITAGEFTIDVDRIASAMVQEEL
jgi:flagellar biosynthesis anti-sigma factor FlgM